MKWYSKICSIYIIMFFINIIFAGVSEFGLQGNLFNALVMTAIFSPIFFIDFTKTATGKDPKDKKMRNFFKMWDTVFPDAKDWDKEDEEIKKEEENEI